MNKRSYPGAHFQRPLALFWIFSVRVSFCHWNIILTSWSVKLNVYIWALKYDLLQQTLDSGLQYSAAITRNNNNWYGNIIKNKTNFSNVFKLPPTFLDSKAVETMDVRIRCSNQNTKEEGLNRNEVCLNQKHLFSSRRIKMLF